MHISLRDPGSAITHIIAFFLTMGGTVPLLIKAASIGYTDFFAMLIFALSMMTLYAASSIYHAVILPENIIKLFRKMIQ